MAATERQIRLLKPFLVGERAREETGEWDMYCPIHPDSKRSASINTKKGLWVCPAGCGGGRLSGLIKRKKEWRDRKEVPESSQKPKPIRRFDKNEVITEAKVKGWASALLSNDKALEALERRRGLEVETLETYEI